MTDPNKKAEEMVSALLDSFKDEPTKSKVILKNKADTFELNMKDIGSEDDISAILTVLMSFIGTVMASTFTGFTGAIRKDLLGSLADTLMNDSKVGVQQKHVDFVNNLLKHPMDRLIEEDENAEFETIKLPMNIMNAARHALAFGVAMHRLGATGEPLKFEAGLQRALTRVLNGAMGDTGVQLHAGTMDETIDRAVIHAISMLRPHEGGTDERQPEKSD